MRPRRRLRAPAALLGLALLVPGVAGAVPQDAFPLVAGGLVALPLALQGLRAIPRPEFYATTGGTFAVLGKPNEGGLSASAAVLWPFEERFAFGLTMYADDLGADLGPVRDPNDPASVLGTVELAHRMTYGAAWRLDARLAPLRGWTPVASGTWGFARVADDHSGRRFDAVGSAGFSLAGALRRAVTAHATLGPTVRYYRLFNDDAGRYMSVALEWGWR
jgi:hypothetical protein